MTSEFADLLELSPAERIQLAQDLWDSILDEPETLVMTEPERQELDRRWAEHLRNPNSAVPWQEARARLRERFGA